MKSNCCNQKVVKYTNDDNLFYCPKCLCLVAFKKKSYNIIVTIILFIFFSFISLEVLAPKNLNKKLKGIVNTDLELNDSCLMAYMNEIDILFPELVLQQIHWESAHFKSKICLENHNLLGIKYIKQKESIGENRGHAVFPTYKSCLRDYKRLQQYYIGNLVGKYAEDPTYGKKLFNYGK
jgi:hypothetical protein